MEEGLEEQRAMIPLPVIFLYEERRWRTPANGVEHEGVLMT